MSNDFNFKITLKYFNDNFTKFIISYNENININQ